MASDGEIVTPDSHPSAVQDYTMDQTTFTIPPGSVNYTLYVITNGTPVLKPRGNSGLRGEVSIPLYCIIFLLAVLGNALVIVTLGQNKRMRTVTNVFLMNLSVSDLLLAVFCMPFTLIPSLLRNFIFGYAMCIMIRYLQGKSIELHLSPKLVCFFLQAKIKREKRYNSNGENLKIVFICKLMYHLLSASVSSKM